MTPTPNARARSLSVLVGSVVLALSCSACGPKGTGPGGGGGGGGGPASGAFVSAEQLRIDRQDWTGPRTGGVWLRRQVQVTVDVAQRASNATSHIREHGVFTRYGGEPTDVVFPLLAPLGSTLSALSARHVGPQGSKQLSGPKLLPLEPGDRVDPGQIGWRLVFPAPPEGAALEFVADVDVPGILDSDARWVRLASAPTAQFLARYNVPTSVAGAFQTRGVKAQPLVTEQDGDNVFAVFLKNQPPRTSPAGIVRYASRSANVRGHKHTLATSWHRLARPYQKELLERTLKLRANHRPPKRTEATGLEGARELTSWTRDRLQRADALSARWDDGRVLPDIIRLNDLRDIDKVHILHWLLDAAGINHRVAVARSTVYPSIDPGFPFTEAFDKPIVYLPDDDVWLDPGCRDCEPGQLRPTLRGAAVLMLPTQPTSAPTVTPQLRSKAAPE